MKRQCDCDREGNYKGESKCQRPIGKGTSASTHSHRPTNKWKTGRSFLTRTSSAMHSHMALVICPNLLREIRACRKKKSDLADEILISRSENPYCTDDENVKGSRSPETLKRIAWKLGYRIRSRLCFVIKREIQSLPSPSTPVQGRSKCMGQERDICSSLL